MHLPKLLLRLLPADAALSGRGAAQWPRFPGLTLQEFVVSAGQAEVYKGVYTEALKLPVAIKVLHLEEHSRKAFVAEIMVLRELHHSNILRMEAFYEHPQLCIVTRWMERERSTRFLRVHEEAERCCLGAAEDASTLRTLRRVLHICTRTRWCIAI